MLVKSVLGDPVELFFSAISASIGTQRKTAKTFQIAGIKLNARKLNSFKTFSLRRFQKIVIRKKKEFVKMKLNPIRRGNCEGTAVDINDMVEFVEVTEIINDSPETNDALAITYNIARTRRAKKKLMQTRTANI